MTCEIIIYILVINESQLNNRLIYLSLMLKIQKKNRRLLGITITIKNTLELYWDDDIHIYCILKIHVQRYNNDPRLRVLTCITELILIFFFYFHF